MFLINIEIEVFVTKNILFCSVMFYWPVVKKSFNSGTHLLKKKINSQNTTKNLDCL